MNGVDALWEMISSRLRDTLSVGDRVYFLRAPSNTQSPYVVVSFPDIEVLYDTPREDWEALCSIECYSQQASKARELAGQVRQALHSKNLMSGQWETVHCLLDTIRVKHEELTGAPVIYCTQTTFVIRITEERSNG